MFVGQQPFYFASVRKISAAFGAIFNNINIARYSQAGGKGTRQKIVRVPLAYARGDKGYTFAEQNKPAQSAVQTRVSLPRITYELTEMKYAPDRKLTTMGTMMGPSASASQVITQLNPVPWDFSYSVYVMTKTIDDGFQILEQILPYFSPSFNITIKEVPELDIIRDVPVILEGISNEDTYEGNLEENRVIIWTLSFTVRGYLYPPITDKNVIKKVIASIYCDKEMPASSKTSIITVNVDPIEAAYEDAWTVEEHIYHKPDEIDSNGDPIEAP